MFCQKQPLEGVLENFAKFIRKHLCQGPLFKPQICNFIKQKTPAQVLCSEFCEIFKNAFSIENLWSVFLSVKLWNIIVKPLRSQLSWNIFHKLKNL